MKIRYILYSLVVTISSIYTQENRRQDPQVELKTIEESNRNNSKQYILDIGDSFTNFGYIFDIDNTYFRLRPNIGLNLTKFEPPYINICLTYEKTRYFYTGLASPDISTVINSINNNSILPLIPRFIFGWKNLFSNKINIEFTALFSSYTFTTTLNERDIANTQRQTNSHSKGNAFSLGIRF